MSKIVNTCKNLATKTYKVTIGPIVGFINFCKKIISDPDERRNYIASEGLKLFYIIIYIFLNLVALIYPLVVYIPFAMSVNVYWIVVAHCGAGLLNLNAALILLPTLRSVLNLAISLKLNYLIPLEKNIVFHRLIAYNIVFATLIHVFGHYMNYSCCSDMYDPLHRGSRSIYTDWDAAWGNLYGLTGHAIVLVMFFMYAAATKEYRKSSNFTVFWLMHHLFILFYSILLVHSINFWLWFIPFGFLYVFERILRLIRGSAHIKVHAVHALKGDVILLELEQPPFSYKAGQYCFLNCPLISRYEWHPFTISSAPEQQYLTFHIRVVGDWTRDLMNKLNPQKEGTKIYESAFDESGKIPLIRVDGPFGTSSDYVWNFEYAVLIAGGIGATPYASILKEIMYRVGEGSNYKLKKVWFYWINRDEGSFEWFSEFLNEIEAKDNKGLFDINTFMTGALEAEKIKKIFFQSNEYVKEHGGGAGTLARVTSDYDSQGSDEIDLRVGDDIIILDRDDSGWWKGKNQTTKLTGLFPSNFIAVIDVVTGMKESKNRHFGRPVWGTEFDKIRLFVQEKTADDHLHKVGVFFCGPSALAKQLKEECRLTNNLSNSVMFKFYKENF